MKVLLTGQFGALERQAWGQALAEATAQALPQVQWLDLTQAQACPHDVQVAVVANPAPGQLSGLPRLALIQSLWAGVERLLDDPTLPPGVPVARMVDPAMNAAMAQTALWAVLSLHRGFFDYATRQRQALWQPHAQLRADEVPVLVLGAGQMGQAAGAAMAGLGYPVRHWRRSQPPAGAAARPPHQARRALSAAPSPERSAEHAPERSDGHTSEHSVEHKSGHSHHHSHEHTSEHSHQRSLGPSPLGSLHRLLREARIVVNLLPLTPATRGLIDHRFLSALPAGASVVNLARGAHVVEADLLAALDHGHLRHAVLDVFQTEPLPAEHPFWRHPQVTVLPHAAAQTDWRSAAQVVVHNLQAVQAGQPLANLVERARGY